MANDTYLDPYRDSALRHGSEFGVTLWANRRSQQVRFNVFNELYELAGKRLLDAGCSRGDLAAYLVEQGIDYASYVGIDGLASVVKYATERRLDRCTFHEGDFLTDASLLETGRPQVILISGSLNTMSDVQVFTVLEAAWERASEAFIFNFLSDVCGRAAPPQDDFARRLDTLKLIEWATSKTWSVVFRQDYFVAGHDATIMMRKQ
jgi:SAM-dependent methyltransferase